MKHMQYVYYIYIPDMIEYIYIYTYVYMLFDIWCVYTTYILQYILSGENN